MGVVVLMLIASCGVWDETAPKAKVEQSKVLFDEQYIAVILPDPEYIKEKNIDN
jgi:hypothetical protein